MRSRSQNSLYLENKERRQFGFKKMAEKYEKINKDMEEKQVKLDKEKKEKMHDLSLKQESDYIKQYQKKQSILRLERINKYKTDKRSEELWEKEKKIEDFKKKKRELIQNKAKLANDMEREKQNLINKFENAFKKKKHIDAEIVKELFPEDIELYNRIKNMTDKMFRTTNILSLNKTSHSAFNSTARIYSINKK